MSPEVIGCIVNATTNALRPKGITTVYHLEGFDLRVSGRHKSVMAEYLVQHRVIEDGTAWQCLAAEAVVAIERLIRGQLSKAKGQPPSERVYRLQIDERSFRQGLDAYTCEIYPIETLHEDEGAVLLWRLSQGRLEDLDEPPGIGSLMDTTIPDDYYTHWSRLPSELVMREVVSR